MKRRTYNNFLKLMKVLQRDKHYSQGEAEEIARQIFENVESDRGNGNRSAEWFLNRIVTKEEWERGKNADRIKI